MRYMRGIIEESRIGVINIEIKVGMNSKIRIISFLSPTTAVLVVDLYCSDHRYTYPIHTFPSQEFLIRSSLHKPYRTDETYADKRVCHPGRILIF